MNARAISKSPALALVLALAAGVLSAAAQGAAGPAPSPLRNEPRAAALVTAFEAKLNLEGLDLANTFTLVQKKEGESDRVLRIRIYRRDSADSFTLIFQFPDSEKGKGYWRSKDDLYLYLPGTREFVYRNRKDDVGSTDVRTDLFGSSRLLDQYWASYSGQAAVAKWDCDVVRLDAKKLDVSYPVQKWYLRRGDGLPVKVENFSAGETLLRTVYYVEYKEVAKGKFIFAKLLSTDALEKGRRTLLSNEGITTARIADYKFSKAFLEEQSR